MTESVPIPAAAEPWRKRLAPFLPWRQRSKPDAIAFADLVWLHHRWELERRREEAEGAESARYRRGLARFEAHHGDVFDAYWSREDASAVALTIKPAPLLLRALGVQPIIRLHRVTDWVTGTTPAIAELLHRCDTLAIRASEVLRGTSERIAMQWIFSVESHLLGFIERTGEEERPDRELPLAKQQANELERVERYYHRAGRQAGRIVYFWGMVLGLVFLAVTAVATAVLLWGLDLFDAREAAIQNFFACYAAGAIGAVVSVLSRMASPEENGRFTLDYEVGRSMLRRLASFRPILGTVFGLAVYFALQGGLLRIQTGTGEDTFYYFAIIAFLAGFSERWTKVILSKADPQDGEPTSRRGQKREDVTAEV